jgi:hypothetical protein
VGIGVDIVKLFTSLRKGGYLPTPSRVIEIGAQQLANSIIEARSSVDTLGLLFGAKGTAPLGSPMQTHTLLGGLESLSPQAPAARELYEWLGFRYSAIDIDGSQGSIPLDLNYDDVPAQERGKYQLVTNFGTTEHVANQLNAFKIIHELTSQAGIMIHSLPAQGFFNHGLVNYNPKFFWYLARSNGYQLIHQNMSFGAQYGLPQNMIDSTAPFTPDIGLRASDYQASDCGILFILQKQFDTPFVAPLDVPTGSTTDIPALKERYWTVFEPGTFGLRYRLRSRPAELRDRLRSRLAELRNRLRK